MLVSVKLMYFVSESNKRAMSAPEEEDIEASRMKDENEPNGVEDSLARILASPEATSRLQEVSVRLANISKSASFPQTNPVKRGRGRPRKASFPPTSSVSASLLDLPALTMGRGKSRQSDSVFSPQPSHLSEEEEVREEISNIGDFLPQDGGPKVQVLSSPNMIDEVYNRYNYNGPEESEIESIKGDVMIPAEDDEDSEIKFMAIDEPSPSAEKESSSPAEILDRLYSDKISPKSPKKYRRSSLMAKLLDNGESDTEEEKEAEKTKLKTKTLPKTGGKRNPIVTPVSILAKKVGESPPETKKRVSFASEVEAKEAREEPVESPALTEEEAEEDAGEAAHGRLEVVWAKIGGHPWWPAIVCNDPELQIFTRTKRRQGNKLAREMNVSFFGENTRAWVVSPALVRGSGGVLIFSFISGREKFEKICWSGGV